jgi:hypothetical protein
MYQQHNLQQKEDLAAAQDLAGTLVQSHSLPQTSWCLGHHFLVCRQTAQRRCLGQILGVCFQESVGACWLVDQQRQQHDRLLLLPLSMPAVLAGMLGIVVQE